ncbi:MAG: cadherin-like domain-containing protein [Burkholderiales bacterium]|nr:cadherin-like domain-containing protein [Burkholderiales bacterium]
MFGPSKIKLCARAVALAFALTASSFSAHAALERVGPVNLDPSVGEFPAWYQDSTGIALEFCAPQNDSEIGGGWCLLLPADVGAVPEAFPTNFSIEHFYYAGTALMTHPNGAKSLLVLAQEASFSNDTTARAGDQTVFSRIRVSLNPVPATGTYRFIHPYGEEVRNAVVGETISFTSDVGIGCGLDFSCSLNSRLGPFLLPSATPGGAEMPPLTAANPTPDTDPAHFKGAFVATPYPGTGKAYIADPNRLGPVTGSPLPDFIDSTGAQRNHNIFRIEGPPGSGLGVDPATGAIVDWAETTDFALAGRLYTGAMPGRVTVDRASYERNASGQKLDVFATAFPTTQGRLPGAPRPAAVTSSLTFFDAPCAGTVDALGTIQPPYSAPPGATETPLVATGALQWAQTQPTVIPAAVCVKDAGAHDASGNPVPLYLPQVVTDEVTVTPAFFDPSSGSLTVGASSSDTVLAPSLTLAFAGYNGDLTAGQITVPGMLAPPANVVVQSSGLGSTQYQVSTGFVAGPAPAIPVAANDSYTFPMNSPAQVLDLLANDSNVAGGTVALSSTPTHGTAVVNADGTVTYTPFLNAFGTDVFTYTVTVGSDVSNTGQVTLDITPVNLPPSAVNDATATLVNEPVAINVVANDTDPNGAADIVGVVNLTQPTPSGATAIANGGVVTFNATATGTYTFTYQAIDAGGLPSATAATVTVQVGAVETLTFTRNQYITSKSRLRVEGTISPIAGQAVRVDFVNGAGAVLGTAGTVFSTTAGLWVLDRVGIALPAGTVAVKATGANGGVLATALTIK